MADEGTQQAQLWAEIAQLDVDIPALEAAVAQTVTAMATQRQIVEDVRAKRRIALAKARRRRWLRRRNQETGAGAGATQIPTDTMLQDAEALYRRVAAMVAARQADLAAMRRRRLELARQLATLG